MYVDIQRFNKPGTRPLTTQTEVKDGCPSDCGLCPEHKQHACLGIIEVNTGCNLDCPICFADSGPAQRTRRLLDHPRAVRDHAGRVRRRRGRAGGGDVLRRRAHHPQAHPGDDRPRPGPARSTRSTSTPTASGWPPTSGSSPSSAERNRPGRRVNIYLQFDGLDAETHLAIRGRDLREIKQQALDNCAEAGLTVTLVAAIEKDLNEHEIGPIIRYGLAHPAVRSVAFQPVTHSGRHVEFDPLTRLTNSDVLHAHRRPAPAMVHAPTTSSRCRAALPTCRSITYLLTQGHPDDAGLRAGADPAAAPGRGLPRLRRQPGRARLRHPRGAGEAVERLGVRRHRRPTTSRLTARSPRPWTAPTPAGSTCPRRWPGSPTTRS